MTNEPSPEEALARIADHLRRLGVSFALVGGLAVSLRAEVRFTRDVDLAVGVRSDEELERLVYALRDAGYVAIASVEHEARGRLATVRLASPSGIVVDLMAASTGIEAEIVELATPLPMGAAGSVKVARAEELLAMKVLSMTPRRLQDRIDAINLISFNDLDLDSVRRSLERIRERGYHRDQDLRAKLDAVLEEAAAAGPS